MMSTVLRLLDSSGLLEQFPAVSAYQARCMNRPAYARAMAAQVALYAPKQAAA